MCGKTARCTAYVHEVRSPALGEFALQLFVTGTAEIGGVTGRKEIARGDYIRCGVLRKHDARSLGHRQYRSVCTPRFYRILVKFAYFLSTQCCKSETQAVIAFWPCNPKITPPPHPARIFSTTAC